MADNWQLKAVISANAEGMLKALKSVNAMSKDTRKYLSDVASSAGKLSGKIGLPFAALSGLLSGFSLMAIKGAVTGFATLGETVHKGALRAGMSVEQWQRMKYVADQAGVGIEALEGSMGKLNKNIGMAASGKSKDLSALFTKLGVSTRGANGELKSGMDILPQLADAFVRNTNPVTQARMGMALFGKSWQEVIPLLMEGSEGITESMERMKRLKGVMGVDDINGAREFGKSLKDMDMVLKGFSMTIAKSLAPVLKPLIDDLVNWFAANKKLVSSEVTKMAKDLGAYIKTIDFASVIKGAGEFFSGLGKLVDMVGGTKNALIGLVLFMNLQTIMAFAGLAGAVGRLVLSLGTMVAPLMLGTTGMASLTAAMGTAQVAGLGLLGILGKLAITGAVGYGIGTLLNNYLINPAVKALTGDKDATLGTALYDTFNPDPMAKMNANAKPSLVGAANQVKASGQIQVSFKDAPPGMRVDQTNVGGDIPLNLDVGYRSYAMGMP